MREAATALLTRAQKAGELRPDVAPAEFLVLVSGIAWAHEQAPGGLDRLLDLIFGGLTPR